MNRYFVELNAKFVKSYRSLSAAVAYAKSKVSPDNSVYIYDQDGNPYNVFTGIME